MIEARYYAKEQHKKVKCLLCPHYCLISPESTGICRVRKNIDGTLYALNYGETVTISLDPMEKKPLYHYYPGKDILSVGSNSCNLKCDFCQNYAISQLESQTIHLTPQSLYELTIKHNVPFVAFTYTEPMTWFEYVLDTSRLLEEKKISSVLVTNGYVNQEPLRELLPSIAAMNIDLKGMSADFYRSLCAGSLQPVLDTIKTAYEHCHIEITNLLIPEENDSKTMLQELIDFIASVSPNIPLHFSRYFPQYKRHTTPTPGKTLETAYAMAKEKLHHVYLGNVYTETEGNTYCAKCQALLIARKNYNISLVDLQGDKCQNCSTPLYGKFI